MTMEQPTSIAAKRSFERSGDKMIHHRIILDCLEIHGDATGWIISLRCGLSYASDFRAGCRRKGL